MNVYGLFRSDDFPKLNYEQTRRIGVIFEDFEIVLMVSCLSLQSFVAPISYTKLMSFFLTQIIVKSTLNSLIDCCTIYIEIVGCIEQVFRIDISERGSY